MWQEIGVLGSKSGEAGQGSIRVNLPDSIWHTLIEGQVQPFL
jgi:hypothetical protein